MGKPLSKQKKLKKLYRKLHDYRDNPELKAKVKKQIQTIENTDKK